MSSVPVATRPLSDRLRAVITLDPTRAALEAGERTFPWQFLSTAAIQLDELCRPSGGAGRHRVGIVLRNRAPHCAAVIATLATGRCLITLSPFHGPVVLLEDIVELRPSVVIASSEDWEIPGFVAAVTAIGAVAIELSDDAPLRARPDCPVPQPVDEPDDGVAVLMLTSGTTGRPKRVPMTYERLTASYEASGLAAGPSQPLALRDDVPIVWTPLVHIGGLYFLIADVLEGKATALMERFHVTEWVALVRRHRPDVLSLVPTALAMVMAADVPPDVFEGVKAVRSGTAPLNPALAAQFFERYGIPVLTNYGATEFAGAVTRFTIGDWKRHGASKGASVGRAVAGTELRIVDRETGAPLATGEIGILHVRSPQVAVADVEGWTRTTDLASIDTDGFVYIHGRADDAVIRGGFKIVPSVVEDALRTHPSVLDAAMVGMPHERLGAVPVAAVQLRSDLGGAQHPPTEAELVSWLTDRLAKYQVPVAVKVVNELPRTPSMKVSRPGLAALFADIDLGD